LVQTALAKAAAPGSKIAYLPDDPVAWAEREFYIPETNGAIQLESYQAAVLRKAFERDPDGNLRYSLMLWSDLKKSAKSTIAGIAVLWMAWHHEWETCRVVGNDLKQANSRTFYYITRAIELNPRLRAVCKVKNYRIELPNHTTIEAIAVDPKGEAGGGDLVVCFTELWAAKNEAAKQLWTETTLSPLKYGKSLRFCESYAGYDGGSPILEQLYDSGVKHGVLVDVGIEGLELYENQSARFICLWNTIPRCSWQVPAYYRQEAATLSADEFRRIHKNEWVSSTNAFIPIEWWDACLGEFPELDKDVSLVVGIDAAVTHDCFAVVAVSRVGEKCYVRYVNVWTPPPHGKIDFSEPEAEIRRLAREYNVIVATYDPMQMEDMAQRLLREGVCYCKPFSQGAPRLEADTGLYQHIMQRDIVQNGNPVMREHLQNADADIDQEGHKMRIVHRTPTLPMDAAVALSQAVHEAYYLNLD
jgi:phage terminase large subunit-like protein